MYPVILCLLLLGQVLTGATPSAAQSGIRQDGSYMVAPVTLDGAMLFRIAAPASPLPGQMPIATRQLAVENAPAAIVAVTGKR